jgi:hypothetical protein
MAGMDLLRGKSTCSTVGIIDARGIVADEAIAERIPRKRTSGKLTRSTTALGNQSCA